MPGPIEGPVDKSDDDLESSDMDRPRRHLHFYSALGLIVGLQVGSGIFASPNQVDQHSGSVVASLLVWAIAGLLAWAGAACYAELGCTIPENGGTEVYLRQGYGRYLSFLYGTATTVLLKPGGAAIIALVLGEYAAGGVGSDSQIFMKCLALASLWGATVGNSLSAKLGAATSSIFLFMKVGILAFLCGFGFICYVFGVARGSLSNLDDLWKVPSLTESSLALYAALWAFDGWDNLNFVTGELHNASVLPRVVHSALAVVTSAFLATNVAYYAVLTRLELARSNSVIIIMFEKVFGKTGKAIAAFVVAVSCLGSINATVYSAGRLVAATARQGNLPRFLEHIHRTRGTPVGGLVANASVASLYILLSGFRSLISLYGATAYVFYILTIAGLLRLRRAEPDLSRSYQVPLVLPVVFCIAASFLVVCAAVIQPMMLLAWVVFTIVASSVYYFKDATLFSFVPRQV